MKSKKFIMFLLGAGIMFSAYAQQSAPNNVVSVKEKSGAKGVDPNIERTRIVNEKIAADKAAAAQNRSVKHTVTPQHVPLNGKTPPATRPTGKQTPPVKSPKTQVAHTNNVTVKPAVRPATQTTGQSLQQQREEGRAKSKQKKMDYIQEHKSDPRVNHNTKVATTPVK